MKYQNLFWVGNDHTMMMIKCTIFEYALLTRVFRKSLIVELDPGPKICDANRYGEPTKISAL